MFDDKRVPGNPSLSDTIIIISLISYHLNSYPIKAVLLFASVMMSYLGEAHDTPEVRTTLVASTTWNPKSSHGNRLSSKNMEKHGRDW